MLTFLAAVIMFQDAKVTDLKDGFVRVETASYSLEVPKGWEIGEETSFGQREMKAPVAKKGEMTAMTAPGGGKQGWDRLYQTSLFFIMRSSPVGSKATPYKLSKTKQGYQAASFNVLDEKGFAISRYVILKDEKDSILALSVKIPDAKNEKDLLAKFDRLVKTARLL